MGSEGADFHSQPATSREMLGDVLGLPCGPSEQGEMSSPHHPPPFLIIPLCFSPLFLAPRHPPGPTGIKPAAKKGGGDPETKPWKAHVGIS